MKSYIFANLSVLKKTLSTVAMLACTLTLPLTSYAAEDTYICNIGLPGNPAQTVTASSNSEAEAKVRKDTESIAKKIYKMTSFNVYCSKKT